MAKDRGFVLFVVAQFLLTYVPSLYVATMQRFDATVLLGLAPYVAAVLYAMKLAQSYDCQRIYSRILIATTTLFIASYFLITYYYYGIGAFLHVVVFPILVYFSVGGHEGISASPTWAALFGAVCLQSVIIGLSGSPGGYPYLFAMQMLPAMLLSAVAVCALYRVDAAQ